VAIESVTEEGCTVTGTHTIRPVLGGYTAWRMGSGRQSLYAVQVREQLNIVNNLIDL